MASQMPLQVPNPDPIGLRDATQGTLWALTAVCVLIVGLRLYGRLHVSKSFGLDDWIMLVAVILRVVTQASTQQTYTWGLGNGEKTLSYDPQYIYFTLWNWVQATLGIWVATTARVSAAILLVRIFGTKRWLWWFLTIYTVIQLVVAIVVTTLFWTQCTPVTGVWQPLLVQTGQATCWDPRVVIYAIYTGQSLFTVADLTYVLFPILVIWKLNMPRRQKIGLAALLALSFITVVASILKIITAGAAIEATPDSIWSNQSAAFLASGIEQCLVVIIGSIPPTRPLFVRYFDRFRTLTASLADSKTPFSTGRSTSDTLDRSRYQDLELNAPWAGGKDWGATAEIYRSSTSKGDVGEPGLPNEYAVRRTDSFAVTFGGSGR
ncbi:hypothetical protein EKO27_g689 [Xylaria grammica]|uniref:Rhodopsin domain-containing protein n=1 Tax=Xylaria grammica TaxID=363999 RepID=A0A439DJ36_9PEZI|nr:hypothetical protein EKO27_g689 [Xylaria grammica]